MEREHQLSELGSFPYENINDLKNIGYTKLTLPKELGGSAISLYDFVLFQEKLQKAVELLPYRLAGILAL